MGQATSSVASRPLVDLAALFFLVVAAQIRLDSCLGGSGFIVGDFMANDDDVMILN